MKRIVVRSLFIVPLLVALFISCQVSTLAIPLISSVSTDQVGVVLLNWDRDYTVDSYIVFRSSEEAGEYIAVTEPITDNQWTDGDEVLASGTPFWYKIVSIKSNSDGSEFARSELSAAVSGSMVPFNANIGVVSSINAEVLIRYAPLDPVDPEPGRFHGLKISWDKVDNADYYRILKEDADGHFLVVNHLKDDSTQPLLITTSEYIDFYPQFGVSNRYIIVPFLFDPAGIADSAGNLSAVVELSLPALPATASWTTEAPDSIRIVCDPVDGAEGYRINRTLGETLLLTDILLSDHLDSGLSLTEKYSYTIDIKYPLIVVVGGIATDPKTCYIDSAHSLSAHFFQATLLEVVQGEGDFIEITWDNAKEPAITEYKIYRQKVQTSWTQTTVDEKPTITFPETRYTTAAELTTNQVVSLDNLSHGEQNKLLFIDTISAVDGEGVRLSSLTWKDTLTDKEKIKDVPISDQNRLRPGYYRYYVAGNTAVISAVGYRTISDKEFIQEVNRYLDLAIRHRQDGVSLENSDGGSFLYIDDGPSGHLDDGSYSYDFNLFDIDYLKFSSSGFKDEYFLAYHLPPYFRYGRRLGTFSISGLYSGTLEYFLSRDWDSRGGVGGDTISYWDNSVQEDDLSYSDSNNLFQGWYRLTRSGSVSSIRWDDGADVSSFYDNETNFDAATNSQHYKVEPDYNSDYIIWE